MGGHCLRDSSSNRPIAGMLLFNLGNMNLTKEYFNMNLDCTVHEIMHILGFSFNHF